MGNRGVPSRTTGRQAAATRRASTGSVFPTGVPDRGWPDPMDGAGAHVPCTRLGIAHRTTHPEPYFTLTRPQPLRSTDFEPAWVRPVRPSLAAAAAQKRWHRTRDLRPGRGASPCCPSRPCGPRTAAPVSFLAFCARSVTRLVLCSTLRKLMRYGMKIATGSVALNATALTPLGDVGARIWPRSGPHSGSGWPRSMDAERR